MADEETTQQIIEAAAKRMFHYGFDKTTMAEIARDCNMSTGNLYRHFENKLAIARAIGRQLRARDLAALADIQNDPSLSPVEKIKKIFQHKLTVIYARFHGDKKAFELSQTLREKVPDFWETWLSQERELIAKILQDGEAAGEICAGEPMRCAELLQAATYQFGSPALYYSGELEDLQAELDELVDLMIDGLRMRAGRPAALATA